MAKRTQYTDEFRSSAVLMLEAAGYPDKKGALSQVARHLGLHANTLRRWAIGQQNPPPNQLVNEKRIDLVTAIRDELAGILGEMPNARAEADYRALATGFGILVDKLQLLTGQATERTENITPQHLKQMSDDELRAIVED